MRQVIGAAVAALALSCAGDASAGTVQIPLIDIGDGSFSTGILVIDDEPADGRLNIVIDFDPDLTLTSGSMTWEITRDYWRWDPIHGNDAPYSHNNQNLAYYCDAASCLTLSQPGRLEGSVKFDLKPFAIECGADTPIWTLCGQSYRYTGGYFMFRFAGGAPGEARNITMSLSAVPEPATWAILIAGFGLAGVSIRRRRIALASC